MSAFRFLIFLHIVRRFILKFLLMSFFLVPWVQIRMSVVSMSRWTFYSSLCFLSAWLLLEASYMRFVLLKHLWGRASQVFVGAFELHQFQSRLSHEFLCLVFLLHYLEDTFWPTLIQRLCDDFWFATVGFSSPLQSWWLPSEPQWGQADVSSPHSVTDGIPPAQCLFLNRYPSS